MFARDKLHSALICFVELNEDFENYHEVLGRKPVKAVQWATHGLSGTDQFEAKSQQQRRRGDIETHFTFNLKENKTLCENCGLVTSSID